MNGVLVSGGGEALVLAFVDCFSRRPHKVPESGAGQGAQSWFWKASGGQLQPTATVCGHKGWCFILMLLPLLHGYIPTV